MSTQEEHESGAAMVEETDEVSMEPRTSKTSSDAEEELAQSLDQQLAIHSSSSQAAEGHASSLAATTDLGRSASLCEESQDTSCVSFVAESSCISSVTFMNTASIAHEVATGAEAQAEHSSASSSSAQKSAAMQTTSTATAVESLDSLESRILGKTGQDKNQQHQHTAIISSASSQNNDVENVNKQAIDAEFRSLEQQEVAIHNALLIADPPPEFERTHLCMAAVDGGGGWNACHHLCIPDATFECQSDAMGHLRTIRDYADFMAGFGRACPNPTWTTDSCLWDGATHTATFFCTYYCCHTVSHPGYGPEVPTRKSVTSHYACMVTTDPSRDNKIVSLRKIWNDIVMLRDLGWLAEATSIAEPTVDDDGAVDVNDEEAMQWMDTLSSTPESDDAPPSHSKRRKRSFFKSSVSSSATASITATSRSTTETITQRRRREKKEKSWRYKLHEFLLGKSNSPTPTSGEQQDR